ncbi:hypothetical protein TNCV_2100301 [Trichonephila clavipes]|nr:hypothetical protein TNCV_2100301 [Trichonephila clavipes]
MKIRPLPIKRITACTSKRDQFLQSLSISIVLNHLGTFTTYPQTSCMTSSAICLQSLLQAENSRPFCRERRYQGALRGGISSIATFETKTGKHKSRNTSRVSERSWRIGLDQDISDKPRERLSWNLDLRWVKTALLITSIIWVFLRVQIVHSVKKTRGWTEIICWDARF